MSRNCLNIPNRLTMMMAARAVCNRTRERVQRHEPTFEFKHQQIITTGSTGSTGSTHLRKRFKDEANGQHHQQHHQGGQQPCNLTTAPHVRAGR